LGDLSGRRHDPHREASVRENAQHEDNHAYGHLRRSAGPLHVCLVFDRFHREPFEPGFGPNLKEEEIGADTGHRVAGKSRGGPARPRGKYKLYQAGFQSRSTRHPVHFLTCAVALFNYREDVARAGPEGAIMQHRIVGVMLPKTQDHPDKLLRR
jgi:hypothetical protein